MAESGKNKSPSSIREAVGICFLYDSSYKKGLRKSPHKLGTMPTDPSGSRLVMYAVTRIAPAKGLSAICMGQVENGPDPGPKERRVANVHFLRIIGNAEPRRAW